MNLMDFKTSLEEGMIDEDLIVFVYDGDSWLAEQYTAEIISLRGLATSNINALTDISEDSALALVMNFDERLNILRTDVFAEEYEDYSQFKNCIIICNKIDKKLEKNESLQNYVIKLPKLVDWQVKDYMKIICPELTEQALDWLYGASKGNIYRILNEIDKINLFEGKEKLDVLTEIANEKNTDLVVPAVKDSFGVFDAILYRDYDKVMSILEHRDQYDLRPFGLQMITLGKLKLIALLGLKGNVTDKELGPLVKQAWAQKKYGKPIPQSRYINAIEFLSAIDNRVKTGELDLPEDKLFDYILTHLFTC